MTDALVPFRSLVTPDQLEEAGTHFVHSYLYRRYGRWALAACFVNIAGLALVIWLGGVSVLELSVLGFVAVVGPVFLLQVYLAYPRRFASSLKQRLIPPAEFFFTTATLGVRTQAGAAEIPWSRVHSVLELSSFYLVVLSPFAITVISKLSLPEEARQIIHAYSKPNAA
jgi:hypothetical protein